MAGMSCYILADTFFVAKGLGSNGLAALNIALPAYNLLDGCGLMIGMGGGVKYSVSRGRGDRGAADVFFTNAMYLTAAFSAIFFIAGVFFSGAIVSALGADGDVFEAAETYARVLLIFSPAFFLNFTLLCFTRNDGAPRLAMLAMVGGSLSNVVLDYVFIFPMKGGMFGAALATGVAPVISLLILSPRFLARRNNFRLVKRRATWNCAKGIFACGFPSLVAEVASGVVIVMFNLIFMSLLGSVGVAAYGIVANLYLVVAAIFTGLAQGVQPLLSGAYGAGRARDASSLLRYALATTAILAFASSAAALFAPTPIVSLFDGGADQALQTIAEKGLKLYFAACPFVGFNIVASMFFAATERPRPARWISLLRGFFLIVPATLLLTKLFGATGTWLAFPTAEAIVSCVGLAFFVSLRRKRPEALDWVSRRNEGRLVDRRD